MRSQSKEAMSESRSELKPGRGWRGKGGVQGVIEKILVWGGRLFAVLPVLLNHLTESTFPSPTCSSYIQKTVSEIINAFKQTNHRIQL